MEKRQYAPNFGRSFEEARAGFSSAEVKMFSDLCDEAKSIYGKKLLSVKLVGSRARGTATEESDYDFLVFLESCDYDIDVPRLEALGNDLTAKHGLGPLSMSPMSPEQYHGLDAKYEGITEKFRRDAITLWP